MLWRSVINSDIAALISRKNYYPHCRRKQSYIQATAAGYFITADGYEKLLTPQKLLSITRKVLLVNFPAESFPEGTVLGKMMYLHGILPLLLIR